MKRVELFLFSFAVIVLFINSNGQNSESSDYTTDSEIDSTIPGENETDSNATKLYLLGFGRFRRPERRRITFRIYFKRIGLITMGRILIFTITIEYSRRIRVLEEKEEQATCTKIEDEGDSIKYDCEAPIDEDKNYTTIKSNGDYESDNVKLKFEETTLSLDANIAVQTSEALEHKSVDLWDGLKREDESTFTINGIINETFSEKDINLTLNDNYGKKDIYCNISNYENNYKLVCTPKHKIDNATLNNAIGIGSNQNVLIHMRNENETLQFNPDGNTISNYYQKKGSSRKLSGGAIAAIVICCVFVVIAVFVSAYLLRKKPLPKFPPEESGFQFYSSTSKFT